MLAEEAAGMNEGFNQWITTGMPLVIAKAGMSLDGKIATRTGDAKWITGEAARREGHRLRARVDAILVGTNTVVRDDPAVDRAAWGPRPTTVAGGDRCARTRVEDGEGFPGRAPAADVGSHDEPVVGCVAPKFVAEGRRGNRLAAQERAD